MKNKITLRNIFNNNKYVFILSLISAIIIWMMISVAQAPDTEKTIPDVPVTIPIEGSAANQLGLDLINEKTITKTVSVVVKGPNYVVSTLSASDLSVSASLSNVTAPGKFNLELKANKVSQDEFEVVGTNPGTILATFDYIDTKKFDLICEAEGASAVKGLVAENAVVSDTNYSTITVKGPRTELLKLDRIVARATVNKTLSETTSFSANLFLLDEAGNELNKELFKITAIDETEVGAIEISVPISKVKEVKLIVKYSNVPNKFNTKDLKYTLNYKRIKIIGPAETINSIKSINLQPINLFEISPENNKFYVKPVLPDGVKLQDTINKVKVTFTDLESYQVRTFSVSSFKSLKGPSGKLSSPIKNVRICAPINLIWQISASDLYAVADLTGKAKGAHNIEVIIKCKKNGTIWQVGTYTATVTVN